MPLSPSARKAFLGFQLVCSLIAVATIASSSISNTTEGTKIMIGSKAVTFAMLMAQTSLVYALYQLVAVEMTQTVRAVSHKTRLSMDLVIALVLVVAGTVLATADFVSDCDEWYQGAVRCGTVKAGVAFTFISAAGYFVLALLQAGGAGEDKIDAAVYVEESTPTAAGSSQV